MRTTVNGGGDNERLGGWAVASLGDLIRPSRSKVMPQDRPDLPFIGLGHVEPHTMRLLGTGSSKTMKSSAIHFGPGDVLYCRLRPYLNKVLCPDFEGLCSAEFIVFPANAELSSKYLQNFLNTAAFVSFATNLNAGDRPRVEFDQLATYEVRLPPLAEQERIVVEIEKHLTRLDAAVKALRRTRANLKRYRASVLKAACEGRLVPTEAELARAESRDYEPAGLLLERILKERRAAWDERELTRAARGRLTPKGTESRSKYRDTASLPMRDLPALREGWLWVGIEPLLSEPMCNGISVKGSNNPPGVPALRLNAMTDRGFLYDAVRYIPISQATSEDLKIVAGDFFVARGNGSLALVGRGTLAQEPPFEVVFPDTMIRLRFAPSASSTDWVPTIWPSALVRQQIQSKIKTTAGIWKIAQPQVASIVVPLPPLAEQKRIVAEVERRLSVIEELQALVAANLKRAERLRQSILKRAFEGKLVPQDPNDEPASVLLERIRAERIAKAGSAAFVQGNKMNRKRPHRRVSKRIKKKRSACSVSRNTE